MLLLSALLFWSSLASAQDPLDELTASALPILEEAAPITLNLKTGEISHPELLRQRAKLEQIAQERKGNCAVKEPPPPLNAFNPKKDVEVNSLILVTGAQASVKTGSANVLNKAVNLKAMGIDIRPATTCSLGVADSSDATITCQMSTNMKHALVEKEDLSVTAGSNLQATAVGNLKNQEITSNKTSVTDNYVEVKGKISGTDILVKANVLVLFGPERQLNSNILAKVEKQFFGDTKGLTQLTFSHNPLLGTLTGGDVGISGKYIKAKMGGATGHSQILRTEGSVSVKDWVEVTINGSATFANDGFVIPTGMVVLKFLR